MHKFIALFILLSLLLSLYSVSAAPAPQDERRIEEQKREILKSTEVHYQEKAPTRPSQATRLQPEDLIYISELSFRKITYGYDLCKLLVVLKGVENEYIGLDAQVTYLKDQDYLPKKIHNTFDPMKPLRRGLTAYVLRKVLNVKGGIFLNIFKESERYALKELTYEGIMSPGNIHEILSGDELASTMTQAINRMGGQ
ncbi:MAG: hypothetical protein KAS66_11945 [Candidatus Omnitrophica bacterium]|nr:hypothetical protein [Candidatus Omnitrophota bacterium]